MNTRETTDDVHSTLQYTIRTLLRVMQEPGSEYGSTAEQTDNFRQVRHPSDGPAHGRRGECDAIDALA